MAVDEGVAAQQRVHAGGGRGGVGHAVIQPHANYSEAHDCGHHPPEQCCPQRRPRDPRLRPQRGRLRGAGRPARRRGLAAGRRRGRRRRGRGQHLRLRRAGQEGLDRRAAGGLRPQGRAAAPRRSSRSAAWPSGTASSSPPSCPRPTRCSGSTPTSTCPATSPPSWTGTSPPRTCRPTAAGCCRCRPPPASRAPPPSRCPGTGPDGVGRPRCGRCQRGAGEPGAGVGDHRGAGPRQRPAGAAGPAGRPAVGAAEDRQRLRPPLCVLRHPDVPRRLRLPSPVRRAGRGPLAGRARRQGDLPRQRELHVVRQGPGRPAAARHDAARAGGRAGASSGCGCPTCSRPRSGPACST